MLRGCRACRTFLRRCYMGMLATFKPSRHVNTVWRVANMSAIIPLFHVQFIAWNFCSQRAAITAGFPTCWKVCNYCSTLHAKNCTWNHGISRACRSRKIWRTTRRTDKRASTQRYSIRRRALKYWWNVKKETRFVPKIVSLFHKLCKKLCLTCIHWTMTAVAKPSIKIRLFLTVSVTRW